MMRRRAPGIKSDPRTAYPKSYFGPASLVEQNDAFRRLFPWFKPPPPLLRLARPLALSEGWFTFPWWPYVNGGTYQSALSILLAKINTRYAVIDHRDPETLSNPIVETRLGLQTLFSRARPNQLMVAAGQFGLSRRNLSPTAIVSACDRGEVPVDLFTVLCWLFTHPGRMSLRGQLNILCAGSAVTYRGVRIGTPAIVREGFETQIICLRSEHISYYNYGTPTFFLPRV